MSAEQSGAAANPSKYWWTITVGALMLAFMHSVWPGVALDSYSLWLFIIALLPWLPRFIKSIEFAGVKIDFKEVLNRAFQRALAGTGEEDQGEKRFRGSAAFKPEKVVDYKFLEETAKTDLTLALAGIGSEIERKLRQLPASEKLDVKEAPLAAIIYDLGKKGVLNPVMASGLNDIASLADRAAHGVVVPQDAAEPISRIIDEVLPTLDDLIDRQRKS